MDATIAATKLKEVFLSDGFIRIITHIDADGISSGAIIVKALKQHNQPFWLNTIRVLEDSNIDELEEYLKSQPCKALMFLDLGAGKINKIAKLAKFTKVFVIDHHQIEKDFSTNNENENLYFIHSYELSGAGLCYNFAKALGSSNKLAQLAVIGMIGDILDRTLSKSSSMILNEAQESGMKSQRSLTIFSAMRPLHKALELSSEIFIPGVTGSSSGALKLLREAGIEIKGNNTKSWRTLIDLSEEEMSRLITAILLRQATTNNNNNNRIINNIYLIKVANMLWDGRELSVMLNACGRLDQAGLGIALLLGSREAKEELHHIYSQYKHHLIKALNWIESSKKIQGSNYAIINAKSAIKDTIIGTVLSILSNSFLYPAGTILIGMAYRDDNKIKISARIVKNNDNNADYQTDFDLNQLLSSIIKTIGGEVGGHAKAAGALILKEKESSFLELLKQELSMHEIKIKVAD